MDENIQIPIPSYPRFQKAFFIVRNIGNNIFQDLIKYPFSFLVSAIYQNVSSSNFKAYSSVISIRNTGLWYVIPFSRNIFTFNKHVSHTNRIH